MANNGAEIVFESDSGISQEEQREILARINRIAEKNRQSLSTAAPAQDIQAKKNGAMLPIGVNVAAVIFLVSGFFLFSSFHGKEDVRIREGSRVYNSAERELINQIRKETSQLIEAKEKEIAGIVSMMDDVDAQLNELSSSNMALTAEQLAAEKRLRQLQDEYRTNLSTLQEDRSRILENSRSREANLQAEHDARIRELAAASQQKEAALDLAQSELDRLSSEQEKAAAIEAQLGASFAVANDMIRKSRFPEAADTLSSMRTFLNAPAVQGVRPIQARKEMYSQSISALEALIDEAIKNEAALAAIGGGELEALQTKNANLEKTVETLNQQISDSNSRGSNTTQQLRKDIDTLRAEKTTLETKVDEQDKKVRDLEAEKNNLQVRYDQARQQAQQAIEQAFNPQQQPSQAQQSQQATEQALNQQDQ